MSTRLKHSFNDSDVANLRRIMNKFQINSTLTKTCIKFYSGLIGSGSGRTMRGLNAWKSLPVRIENEKLTKCNKF